MSEIYKSVAYANRHDLDQDPGHKVRVEKELINRILDNKINAEKSSLTVGFGFACPFLENKIKDTGNKNFLLLMPSEQGVISWPSKSKSVTALVDEVS